MKALVEQLVLGVYDRSTLAQIIYNTGDYGRVSLVHLITNVTNETVKVEVLRALASEGKGSCLSNRVSYVLVNDFDFDY